jgi:hypothetical protein
MPPLGRLPGIAPIVGTWLVKTPEAPFPYHMFVFHSDGTVQQSNPDAGDSETSDSNAMGVWVPEGDSIKGRIVEITADRTTRHFVSRGENLLFSQSKARYVGWRSDRNLLWHRWTTP